MKDTPIIAGVALLAAVVGVYFFLQGNASVAPVSNISESQPATVAILFTSLVHGTRSTVGDRVNYIIKSTADLQKLWNMVDATGAPPEVDFTKEAVIAVFAGKQPTAGYAITVSKITDSNARLVSITIQKPDSTCKPKATETMPYELVTIPATMLPLAHEDISATVPCP